MASLSPSPAGFQERLNRAAFVQQLLERARTQVSQGDSAGALQTVIEAIRVSGGDESILPTLHSASEAFHQGRGNVQELADILANMSISLQGSAASSSAPQPGADSSQARWEQHPAQDYGQQQMDTGSDSEEAGPSGQGAVADASWGSGGAILQETGREGIAQCAMADGSSYVCATCGGVVCASRRRQHDEFWCQSGGG